MPTPQPTFQEVRNNFLKKLKEKETTLPIVEDFGSSSQK